MDFAAGVLLGIGLAAAGLAAWRLFHAPRAVRTPAAAGMQSALHAASSTLPYLRRGLNARSAAQAAPHLRALTGSAAIALADTRAVLAIDGEGREQVRPGDLLSSLLARTPDDRMQIVPRLISSDPTCPLRSAVLAPLTVQGKRAGTLIAFYRSVGRPRHYELRVVQKAAILVSAQVELSVVAEQEERLAQAELRALRAQISPHFIYNALAAVAGDIHARPEEARELLIDFAEFTRYLFRDGRSYVTLAEEVEHVERYLRLERARFRDSLHVTVHVPPGTRWSRRCRCSRWSRTRSVTASSAGRAAGGSRSPRASSMGTSSCGCAMTAAGSSPSACPRCSPEPAAVSGSRTSMRGFEPRSASATRCASIPASARGRRRS